MKCCNDRAAGTSIAFIKTIMKTLNLTSAFAVVIASSVAFTLSACSSSPKGSEDQQMVMGGPRIVNPRAQSDTIELNQYFQAKEPNAFFVDVQDFGGSVENVKLRFLNAPIEIPMDKVGGTTYRGELSSQQLKSMAVTGKTMKYDAKVVARNDRGVVSVSKDTLSVEVEAPDFKG